jgi:predicted DNA binding CopG/RHH family protein
MALITNKGSRINVRLPSRELKLWHREAAAAGLTLSDWLRGLVTAAIRGSVETAPTEAQKESL